MKKLLFLVFFLSGCATIDYEGPDGTRFSYNRLGEQSLDSATIQLEDGSAANISGQKSQELQILELVGKILESVK